MLGGFDIFIIIIVYISIIIIVINFIIGVFRIINTINQFVVCFFVCLFYTFCFNQIFEALKLMCSESQMNADSLDHLLVFFRIRI